MGNSIRLDEDAPRNIFSQRRGRVVLFATGINLLATIVVIVLAAHSGRESIAPSPANSEFSAFGRGADSIALTDSDGHAVRWGALAGVPRAVFFGFTNCPEVCPTTMSELAADLKTLGPRANSIRVDFVSLDPERDTPDVLRDFMSSFGAAFHGYTGSPDQLKKLAKAYHVFYERVATPGGGYTIDHSAIVYLLNAQGSVAGILSYGLPKERAIAQLSKIARDE